jgi:hypothetical protein
VGTTSLVPDYPQRYALRVRFENSKKNQKNLKIGKNQFFFENYKNQNNVKKIL